MTPGTLVKLLSGGPEMVVESVSVVDGAEQTIVVWCAEGTMHREQVSAVVLRETQEKPSVGFAVRPVVRGGGIQPPTDLEVMLEALVESAPWPTRSFESWVGDYFAHGSRKWGRSVDGWVELV